MMMEKNNKTIHLTILKSKILKMMEISSERKNFSQTIEEQGKAELFIQKIKIRCTVS